jgi:hypothetical protein
MRDFQSPNTSWYWSAPLVRITGSQPPLGKHGDARLGDDFGPKADRARRGFRPLVLVGAGYFTSVLDFHLTSPGSTSSRIFV